MGVLLEDRKVIWAPRGIFLIWGKIRGHLAREGRGSGRNRKEGNRLKPGRKQEVVKFLGPQMLGCTVLGRKSICLHRILECFDLKNLELSV